MSDIDWKQAFEFERDKFQRETVRSFRLSQQLAEAEDKCEKSFQPELDLLLEIEKELVDIEYLGSHAEGVKVIKKQVESLRQQLAFCTEYELPDEKECRAGWEKRAGELKQQLAECQARENVLRDALDNETDATENDGLKPLQASLDALALPFDSTALDQAIRKAKREVLIEAANIVDINNMPLKSRELRRMAELTLSAEGTSGAAKRSES
jgi:hypothetical protein